MLTRSCLGIVAMGLAVALMVPWSLAAEGGGNPPAPQARTRIGTYNTRAVALAYGRCEVHNKFVSDLVKEADKAKAANDPKRLAELKAQGESQQKRLHAQVFSNAPIDDILPALKEAFPAIAKETGVVAIVSSVDFQDASVEVVDVTGALVEVFKPTDKTRQMIQDLLKHPPVDAQVLKQHKH